MLEYNMIKCTILVEKRNPSLRIKLNSHKIMFSITWSRWITHQLIIKFKLKVSLKETKISSYQIRSITFLILIIRMKEGVQVLIKELNLIWNSINLEIIHLWEELMST